MQPSLHWGQEWELGREPLLWPPHANQKQVLGVTEEGEGCDNVGRSCLQACLPSFSRPWLQTAPETLCTLVPGELPPFWGPRPRQRAASPESAQTGQTPSPGVLITAYHREGALAAFPTPTAPSLRECCGAPLLEWRPWPLPPNKCDGKHHPSTSLGSLLRGGKEETTLVCSRPPTSCFLPKKPPLIMPSGGLLGGPPGHSDASSFLCLLQLCLKQAWHPPACSLNLGQWPPQHSPEQGP